MRWCQTILLLIAALYGSSAAAADGEFLQLNARARIHCNGAGVALTNGARTIEFQPNIGYNNNWISLGSPRREPQFHNPGNYNEWVLEYDVPGGRIFRLAVKTFQELDGIVVDGRLINGNESNIVEYFFWSWHMDATDYVVPEGEAMRRQPFDRTVDNKLDHVPFVFLPFDRSAGGLAVAANGIVGYQYEPDGDSFLYERAIEHDQELPPGGCYHNAFGAGLVADAGEAAAFYRQVSSYVSFGVASSSVVDYGRPGPEWLTGCRTLAGYYRPWSVEDGKFWSDEVLDTRLKDFSVIIGSQPNPDILARVHRRGKKLLYYVGNTCYLDAEAQLAGGREVFDEWRESVLSDERLLDNHPDWVCIDENGERFHDLWGTMHGHMGLFYNCLHQDGVQEAALRQVAGLMELGYDGIFVDLAGPTVECYGDKFGIHSHAEPEKSNTDKYFELLDKMYALVKSYGDDRAVILNGPIASHWPRADALMWESAVWVGGTSRELNQTPAELVLLGKRYAEARKHGKLLLPLVYLPENDPDVFNKAMFSYAYAMIFDLCWTDYTALWDRDAAKAAGLYGLRLGEPENDGAEAQPGVWRRDFSRGTIFWNVSRRPAEFSWPAAERKPDVIGAGTIAPAGEGGWRLIVPSLGGCFLKK